MPIRHLILALLAVLVTLPCAPAPALAVTASVEEQLEYSRSGSYVSASVTVTASPGEANDLLVDVAGKSTSPPVVIRVRDERSPVTAGQGCEAVDPHEARCVVSRSLARITADLADADDRARVTGDHPVGVKGGPGDDDLSGPGGLEGGEGNDRLTGGPGVSHLHGGPGDDELTGGPRNDTLTGGGGTDALRGGAGNDRLEDQDGAAPGPDILEGGEGTDVVDYRTRVQPVVVVLPDRGGAVGEGDVLVSLESAVGGDADDVLTGDGGASELDGQGGDDRLTGGGGKDQLIGGDGNDDLDGGPGDDLLVGRAGDDRLAAGAGRDIAGGEAGRDAVRGGEGPDTVSGGGGVDELDGGDGDDTLEGGAQLDRITAGPGRDRVASYGDFFADAIACGTGRDRAEIDRGERPSGCERRAFKRPTFAPELVGSRAAAPPSGGPTYDVRDGRANVMLDCLDLGLVCDAQVTAHVRRAGRRVVVLLARPRCEPEIVPDTCYQAGDPKARLTTAGRRLLREHGRLRARATIFLEPGRAHGALPIPGRLVLRR